MEFDLFGFSGHYLQRIHFLSRERNERQYRRDFLLMFWHRLKHQNLTHGSLSGRSRHLDRNLHFWKELKFFNFILFADSSPFNFPHCTYLCALYGFCPFMSNQTELFLINLYATITTYISFDIFRTLIQTIVLTCFIEFPR